MNKITQQCAILNPEFPWESFDLSHIVDIKITINHNKPHIMPHLIASKYWPAAVDDVLIVKTAEQRQLRARSILNDFVRQDLKGKRFLDFGCGSGECVAAAMDAGAIAVGYDQLFNQAWTTQAGLYSTNFDELVAGEPYDIILLYDVLDHLKNEEVLERFKVLTKPTTKLYVRCHPYCSRHGTHLYNSFNKAYAHLFMSDLEITAHGGRQEDTHKIFYPERIYASVFKKAGWKVLSTTTVSAQLETFIETFLPLLREQWGGQIELQELAKILSIQFLDYVLEPIPSEQ
jgi:SAM-dependent methyltransferase